MGRLIIISNRLPFSIDHEGDQLTLRQSSGGLVSAIKSYIESDSSKNRGFTEKLWAGVADFPQNEWTVVAEKLSGRDFQIIPLFVNKLVYKDYYNGFSNSVLWPLFHYFPNLVEYQAHYYDAYVKVNRAFADKLIPVLQPDDTIWIHDYQLMLLPEMLRTERPDITVGFFLHIPFPSYELFRTLPTECKSSLLKGVLGSDLIGFHTHDYAQHFLQSVKMILGVDSNFHNIQYQDRLIKADLFPISIDYKKFNKACDDPETKAYYREIKNNFEGRKIIFSVDRLDYTKGLMDRLNAFDHFLEQYPEWREKVVFILNIVPSRDDIQAYTERKQQIEQKIGTINGKISTITWQPIIYRYTHLPFTELAALYKAADAALITPLRDGMNLVAKEYVASSSGKRGVLILSELAGAANELNEALLVNPTDIIEVSKAIHRALTMPQEEQQHRITLMQQRLSDYDVIKWVSDFLDQLSNVKAEQQKQQVKVLDEKTGSQIHLHYQISRTRCLLLDYDGTLVPYARMPADAKPNEELRAILTGLSQDPKNNVVIISGREADSLEKWLGDLPLMLVAEHGASFKNKGEQWQQAVSIPDQWKNEIRPIMQLFVTHCVGSFIEEKTNTLAWHYRNTHPDLGFTRSRELINNLTQLLQNTMLQVVDGNKVVEVRMSGFDKGIMAMRIVNDLQPDFVLCIGDDTTDEDMFKALAERAYSIKVSNGPTAAQYTVFSQQKVLQLLKKLMLPVINKQYAGT
ncbi:bifunctional alpha,alpha-trehalose-phosphate synthase (UDP-forming)/trehalose-phosphatase [Niastella vici]|uniref:Bifunctional alpha,alpha-trehalose-phosphate synthase (UDP-forming)/trehalose-phosphatase n=1 Tax=Niastella vici TaxID=1703345 RepID=A0A1V9FWA3_9BACT|nr:bifunctional alpha,alpha-trehalose-phosphate synthase (UDP-forming)/trehalose-phosphatase [Niastella vici]OQP62607.1 bifunctional alpha,alpha-trehalose-phosphate synthase (UDP-forming)/trehalose-phosphatase [Niastella vici]